MNFSPETRPKLSHDDYTVAWLCVLNYEIDVATTLLDEKHDTPYTPSDGNAYTVGRIGKHHVVILKFTHPGTINAATTVTNMLRTFENIRFGLMVGTGGGAVDAPNPQDPAMSATDILLGDVVLSKPQHDHGGVLQYDRGKRGPEGFTIRAHLNSPGSILISAVDKLAQNHRRRRGHMARYIKEAQLALQALDMDYFDFPGRDHDLLFAANYHHRKAAGKTCRGCDRAKVVDRASLARKEPIVHHGLIASGDTLLRDPQMRDRMRTTRKVLCFEMETAGIMNSFPCLAIRGISNYADTHKNDLWQPYAALTAAAYAKDLLSVIQPRVILGAEMASRCMPNFA